MLVGYMKEGKHGSRLRGMKEGRSEWIGTEGAEPGTGSRGRGPRSDHRELRTLWKEAIPRPRDNRVRGHLLG